MSTTEIEIRSSKETEMKINLHIAEYNALTMRITYSMNINYALLGALLLWLSFMISNFKPANPFYIWTTIGGMQVIETFYLVSLKELYRNSLYIESHLKPKIRELIDFDDLWQWEPFIAKQRGYKLMLTEWLCTLMTVVAFSIAYFYDKSWKITDIGFYLNCGLFVMIAIAAYKTQNVRLQFCNT